jgi:hypothetical protein
MPAADTFAMTSTWPEAFGMVPAESAACGVPPVSADHSGMREVARLLAGAIDPDLAPLLSFRVGPGAIPSWPSASRGGSRSIPGAAGRWAESWPRGG